MTNIVPLCVNSFPLKKVDTSEKSPSRNMTGSSLVSEWSDANQTASVDANSILRRVVSHRSRSKIDDQQQQHKQQARIHGILENIEREHDIKIILAVEMGSREWSTESSDSSYDVRFVFVRNDRRSYLTLANCDELETTVQGASVDLPSIGGGGRRSKILYEWLGYDVAHALKLVGELNPLAVEMFYASTVYKMDAEYDTLVRARLRDLLDKRANIGPLVRRYRSMATANYLRHIEPFEHTIKIKRYFDSLRLTFMIEWLLLKHADSSPLPANLSGGKLLETNFTVVLDQLRGRMKGEDADVCRFVTELVNDKQTKLNNLAEVNRMPRLDRWLQRYISEESGVYARLRESKANNSHEISDEREIGAIFHTILKVKFQD